VCPGVVCPWIRPNSVTAPTAQRTLVELRSITVYKAIIVAIGAGANPMPRSS
jgi:hypothetical protein